MRVKTVTSVVILASLACQPVFACGESLFRVGKGLTFREYTAPLPGNILVVARTEPEKAMADALASAGHHVHVVGSTADISDALDEHDMDIVLGYFDERNEISQELEGYSANYIPVTTAGQNAAAYARSIDADSSVKVFLKTLHRSLREQQS